MFGNSFGGLAGLGGVPQRRTAPNSQVVDAPFADWGNAANWQTDWQQRYDAEMLKPEAPVYERPVWETTRLSLIPGAPGYNASAARPYHEQIRARQDSEWNPNNDPARQAAMDFARERGMTLSQGFDGSMVIGRDAYSERNNAASRGASHEVGPTVRRQIGTRQYFPAGDWRNLGPLYAEQKQLQGPAENQMRNQQAYQWMEGGGQSNAMMSPDYANAGFNQITGLMNPYGPTPGAAANVMGGQNPDISMDFSTGAYDPSTQRGTGAYQTNAMRQRSGW